MESVACMLKSNLEYLNVDVLEVRATGGGANSPLWCQIKADMVHKRLVTLERKETACLGGAILAGVGTGVFPSVGDACRKIKIKKIFYATDNDYSEVYNRYKEYDDLLNTKR